MPSMHRQRTSFRVVHRTNDFRTDLLDAKLPESLVPHLVCSLGDPAQEPRVADDALSSRFAGSEAVGERSKGWKSPGWIDCEARHEPEISGPGAGQPVRLRGSVCW